MASSEQPLPSAFTSAETRKQRIETHAAFMKKATGALTALNHNKLNELHEKVVGLVTNGVSDGEKDDLTYLLDIQWCNIVEEEEERIWWSKGKQLDSHVCIYLSSEWVYVAAYTRNLGNKNITFGNPKATKPGFEACIRHSNGKLCWGYDYDNITKDEQGGPVTVDWLSHYIVDSFPDKDKKLAVELFQRVKEFVDVSMDECIPQLFLITPNYCNFRERTFLRECCIKADFKRVVIIKESFPTLYRILSKLELDTNQDKPSILLLENTWGFLKLEVLGADTTGNEGNAVQLHTAARGSPGLIDSVKNAYRRALARLSIPKRESIRYYVLLRGTENKFHTELNEYLSKELKLTKVENLSTNNNILEVFSQFSTNPTKLMKPIFGLDAPRQIPPAIEKLERPLVANSKLPQVNNQKATPAKAKIPLKIQGHGGKMIAVLAYSDWTVKKLKEEYNRVNGQQIDGGVELQHTRTTTTTRVLNDDHFLSLYKLEPDSVIQANFGGAHDASGNLGECILVANCIARERGTEETPVEGVKEGDIVFARTDMENLTAGLVGASCKINGYGDKIFVGVKFKKHLPLGSSRTRIEHVAGKDVECDKCKGRKCLFIPIDHVGPSKDNLFEVQ